MMNDKMSINAEELKYQRYRITRAGRIYDQNDKDITHRKRIFVWDEEKNKMSSVSRGKLVYQVFSGEKVGFDKVIVFKDGDEDNCAYDNIVAIEKSEYMYKKHGGYSGKLSQEAMEKIRHLYKEGMQQKELAKIYNCSQPLISKIVRGSIYEKN